MKILAVCFGTLGGVGVSYFYKGVICELARTNEVDVLCTTPSQSEFAGIRNFYYHPFSKRMFGWSRRFLRWFGTTPISGRWGDSAAKFVADDYDVVLSITSAIHLDSVVGGRHIAEKLGCKFAIYTVDAIPAPGGWTRKRGEFRGKKRVVAKEFAATDYLAASNSHMLEYQLSLFDVKGGGIESDVVYTPTQKCHYNLPVSSEVVFLYTGALYGLRNPDYLFKAFKRLLAVYPDAQIILVGYLLKLRNINKILNAEERKHVIIYEATSDLEPFYRRAKVLIDIDADLNKDPFLSSKIVSYTTVNRVILSETGRMTPSRELFAGLNTVIQCDHNEDSLYEGMLRAIEVADSNPDFSEREPLVKAFSIESVGAKLCAGLARVCEKSTIE